MFTTADGHKIDFYYPPLGSSTTNVNISAVRGDSPENTADSLRSKDGRHVKRGGSVIIMGRRVRLTTGRFNSYSGPYQEEQVSFVAGGWVWRLTMSYDLKFKSLRPTMMRMLQSFKLRPGTRQKHTH